MSVFKKGLADLSDYRVEQRGFRVKLNQNESPEDWPDDLKRAVLDQLRAGAWNRYPDGEAGWLREKLTRYVGRPASWILPGNGSNELIQAVFQACCRPGDAVVTATPGFSVYARVARVLGVDNLEVPLDADFAFDVPAMVEASRSASLVFLASPHNPTGSEIDHSGVEAVARACSGIVALDEAYFEYSGTSGMDLLDRLDNLVILRTFSKAWGLAGFRLGYMVARPELISPVSKARLPFSVGLLQQLAGVAALSMADRLRSAVGLVVEERERMYRILSRSVGFRVYPSRANFLLFECLDDPADEVSRRLAEGGVAVRRFQDPRLARALRVTVGTREENRAFLAALGAAPAGE